MAQSLDGRIVREILTGTVITVLVFAVAVYLPIIGFFTSLLIPIPVLFYRARLGRNSSAAVAGASFFGMVVIGGGFSVDLLFFGELLVIGFSLGELIERGYSIEWTVLLTCGTVALTGIGGLLLYGGLSGQGPVEMVSGYVDRNLRFTLDVYEKMGVGKETIERIAEVIPMIQYVLLRILPGLATASSLFVSWTSLLLAKPFFQAKAVAYPDLGRLSLWKAPEQLVWVAIGCGALLLLPATGLKIFGLNGAIVLMTIYFFQGIAIVSFFFEKKRFPTVLRLFLYSLIALQQVVLILVVCFGFFDMWLNFRKLETNKSD